jgi:DNA-binding IclR family transcriptional regulator
VDSVTALALDAEYAEGHLVARASVRSLAHRLHLDKDTVARAVIRLRDAGLVVHEPGRFTPGIYRLTVPSAVIRFAGDAPMAPTARRHAHDGSGLQLALLEAD